MGSETPEIDAVREWYPDALRRVKEAAAHFAESGPGWYVDYLKVLAGIDQLLVAHDARQTPVGKAERAVVEAAHTVIAKGYRLRGGANRGNIDRQSIGLYLDNPVHALANAIAAEKATQPAEAGE